MSGAGVVLGVASVVAPLGAAEVDDAGGGVAVGRRRSAAPGHGRFLGRGRGRCRQCCRLVEGVVRRQVGVASSG